MSLAAGQSAAQVLGTGTIVSIGGPVGGTDTFVPIKEITDFKNSGFKTALATVTNFDSQGVARKVATITDLGSVTFTANRIPGDPGQTAVNSAQLTRQAYDFKMTLPLNPLATPAQTVSGDVVTFSGIITSAGAFDVSIDKASEYTFSVELNSWNVVTGS